MITLVLFFHILASVVLVFTVLLQSGKGAEMGAAFGGASKGVFGPRGAAGPLAKVTIGAAVMFMFTSILLTYERKEIFAPTATPPAAVGKMPVPAEAGGQGGTASVPLMPGNAGQGQPAPATTPLKPIGAAPTAPTAPAPVAPAPAAPVPATPTPAPAVPAPAPAGGGHP